jgi:large subunit ribosomal protein L17
LASAVRSGLTLSIFASPFCILIPNFASGQAKKKMKHQKKGRKFARTSDQKKALMRSLLRNFIFYEKIQTTEAKAKELKSYIEKIITKANKKNNIAGRRLIQSRLNDPKSTKKLFENIAPRYKTRKGGYTRIIKLPPRKKDGAKIAIIEFV